jgi:hypothetical protein
MITNTNQRFNGEHHPPIVRQQSVSDALESLVIYELGYGGKIMKIERDKLVLFTQVLSTQDTVTFEGTEDEMLPLLQFCAVYSQVSGHDEINEAVIDNTLNRLGPLSGKPLFITGALPMFVGQSRIKLACLGWINIEDQDTVKRAARMSTKDLLQIVMFMEQFPNMDFFQMADELSLEVPELV